MIFFFQFRQPQNTFELEKLECNFDAGYFHNSAGECVLKTIDGRNKFVSGHGELTKTLDEIKVSRCGADKK